MDLRAQRTLKNLEQALVELLHEKSLNQITVSEICDRALVRRATFYRHFKDLNDLFEWVVVNKRTELHEQVMQGADVENVRDYCARMTKELLTLVEEHRSILQTQRLNPQFLYELSLIEQQIASEFAKVLADHEAGEPVNRDIMAQAVFYAAGLMGVVRAWLEQDKHISKDELLISCDAIASRLFPE